jgi:hypothetical protein
VRSRCLHVRFDLSLSSPNLLSYGHYGEKTGSGLVKIAQGEKVMQLQLAVLVNEARFAELIHEETYASARGPDHIGQRVLTDLWNDHLRLAFFPEVGSNRSHAPAESPGQ